jgi:Mn-dependent DtxR family transcriptional regulator
MTEPASTRPGRPRPQDTIDRDEKVYQILTESGALKKPDVAERLGIEPKLAYMSLYRLRRQGYVQKSKGNKWEAVARS